MANEQNHEIKTFGPQFFIETGSDKMEYSGKAVYKIASQTKKGEYKNNMSFHETGFARYYTEDILQMESGVKGSSNEVNFRSIVHNGHYSVNADKGEIRLAAKNIIIEASEELTLLAKKKVQIGYPNAGVTKEIKLQADKVIVDTKGGNLGDALGMSSIFKSFAGSFVSPKSIAKAAAGMYGGPVASAAVDKVFP